MGDAQGGEVPGGKTAGGIEVIPTGMALGAEVRGLDLSNPLGEEAFRAVRDAWAEHLVLLFRGQDLTPEQHIAFSARFGEPERPNVSARSAPITRAYPEIVEITNVSRDGGTNEAGLGDGEVVWHSDMSYTPAPPAANLLYAREIPAWGGSTCFCNMYAAYDSLPEEVRERIGDQKVVHDESRNSGGFLRPGYEDIRDPTRTVGPRHPLVRTHPLTKRKVLYLGRRPYGCALGLPVEESEKLLDFLWAHATQEKFVWCHDDWKAGDLLFWDNRAVMHRTQVAGEVPV